MSAAGPYNQMTDQYAGAKGRAIVRQLDVAGAERSYLVYRPPAAGQAALPLMIVLHGGLGNAKHMEERTGMNDIADSGRFIVSYPEGTEGFRESLHDRRTWNAGCCCGPAARRNIDDVLFMERMIDDIHARYAIDTRRVYVTGMSNGAMMAYRLACEIPGRIAAIIPVSGTLALDNGDGAKDVPVLHIHGDQDWNVPFTGGVGKANAAGMPHRSVPDTMRLILRSRQVISQEQKTSSEGIQATLYHAAHGAPVTLYVIRGGGHVWPGGNGRNDRSPGTQGISASRIVWEFARQFSKTGETEGKQDPDGSVAGGRRV